MMTVQEDLDALRHASPGCRLTAFGDLSTSLILRFSSDEKVPREQLDQLCARAAGGFALARAASDVSAEISAREVICFTAQRSEIFARASDKSDDMVCSVVDGAHALACCSGALRDMAERQAED